MICKDALSAGTAILGYVGKDKEISLASTSLWKDIQMLCPDLYCAHALIILGHTINKKEANVRDLRLYVRFCIVYKEGLLVHLRQIPFQP